MEFVISAVGMFVFLLIYKLFTGSLPDFFLSSSEILDKNIHKNARKDIKYKSPEIAYQSVKYLPNSFSKDQMLSDVAIKLSKSKLHELAIEALDSIQSQNTRILCILSGELDFETVEIANKQYADKPKKQK